ncbi:DMT family transporter [Vibrio sp. SCSIO 43137]|uniref:DMT family transporter n=1 Tax=Vibrio sp. SCSIO 43137 TaxID=3021011 RepID=UPI0023072EF0|nr:DMT family transporter [Vibrio sp. SCSIO 43137]WCE29445.1 DMT family transporter [Vibrio sp. SCSIO 43137]
MQKPSAVTIAIISLVAGNFLASLSDVAVKLLEGEVFTFEYVFVRQLMATLILAPIYFRHYGSFKGQSLSWKITLLRANLIVIGAACMVVAVTYLPLATANAVFYAAPLLMLPVSFMLLAERPAASKVVASAIGFIGVLIVLRPSQFHWAACFALGTAVTLALFSVLVRKLPSQHGVVHTLFWTSLFSLPVSGLLALMEWQEMSTAQLGWTVLSSVCVLAYNGLSVFAYKKAPASQIALSEYTGLVFVTLFGVMWFDEIPDLITLAGIILIIAPLIPAEHYKKLGRRISPQAWR